MADGIVGRGSQQTAEVHTKQLHAEVVLKLRPDKVADAIKAAPTDGADNVFFTVGKDTFVASARHMNLRGISRGDLVNFNGQTATITAIDSQLNSAGEGWTASSNTGYVLGTVAGLGAGGKQAVTQLTHPYEYRFRFGPHTIVSYHTKEELTHLVSGEYAKKLSPGKILGRAGGTALLVAGGVYLLTKIGGAIYGAIDGQCGPDLDAMKAYAQ